MILTMFYAAYFFESQPARAVVEAVRIPRDALVEIIVRQ